MYIVFNNIKSPCNLNYFNKIKSFIDIIDISAKKLLFEYKN